MTENVANLRKDYRAGELRRAGLAADPMQQFGIWFAEAAACPEISEPNAMTLATSDLSGLVLARVVLLKGLDPDGFRFFTNYGSRKARQIESNSRVSLSFYWAPLERQVLVAGRAERLPREESEQYFVSRPRTSQLGAWASSQSSAIPDRNVLEENFSDLEKRYANRKIPIPPFWGGYLVRPSRVEFWQGRTGRLHDRFLYESADGADGDWRVARLSP